MRRALQCLAVIAVADYVILRHPPRWHAIALFDHPAHVATAILLGGTDRIYLAGSLLPDLDHIPVALGDPEIGDPRPNTHSLLVVGVAAAIDRRLGAGAAAHFVRDLAMGPGVPLLWPFTKRLFRVPYSAYAVLVLATAYSRSRPWRAAPAHIPGASGRGP
jgi:inner membrane protein